LIDPVKPRRKYASGRRAQQAGETRRAIVSAARQMFVAAGWRGTTIAGVARAGGVSTETVYAVFGSKKALLLAVVEAAVRRDEPSAPLLQQARTRAVIEASGQHLVIERFSADIADVLAGVAPVMAVVRAAAKSDPEIADLYAGLHAGRRRNLAAVASSLAAKGPLRGGQTAEHATALIWRLASPDLFLLMTEVEGLGTAEFAQWLATTLTALLLNAAPER